MEKTSILLSTRKKKELVLNALDKNLGNITAACKVAQISRVQFYRWLENDPKFKEKYEALDYAERLLDVAEHRLYEEINKGNLRAVIYFLSTKGAKRGWGKPQSIDVNAAASIVIQDVDKGFFTAEALERNAKK